MSAPPSGWKESRLSDLGVCIRGVSYNPEVDLRERDSLDSARLLRSNNVQDSSLDLKYLQFVSMLRVSPSQKMTPGDVLICMANGSKQLVGKAARFDVQGSYKYTFGAFMGVYRPFDKTDSGFIYFLMQSKAYKNYLDVALSGSSINNLRPSNILEMTFTIPERDERIRISTVLGELDLLVRELDKLIVKKRDIKQGAMQQLLTGKTRLKGFSEDWRIGKVRDLTRTVSGGTPDTSRPEFWADGQIPWMSSGELHARRINRARGRITVLGLVESSAQLVPPGSVLIGLAGQGKTRGTVAITEIELCTNQSIAAILPTGVFCSDYLFHNLSNRYEELRSLSTGDGGRGGLNLTILGNLEIPWPILKEQQAIAQVLSDMDAEIDALVARREKTALIKTGMMQELLTGRTRLL